MSLTEVNLIDALGESKTGNDLILMIADQLDWKDETNHLEILQEKINTYLGYIENEEYLDRYPDRNFDFFVIEVFFAYPMTENCNKFIQVANKQLSEYNIKIIAEYKPSKNN